MAVPRGVVTFGRLTRGKLAQFKTAMVQIDHLGRQGDAAEDAAPN